MSRLKRRISNGLIAVGAALLIVFTIYQCVGYPWRALFAQWGWIEISYELVEPAPLPDLAFSGEEDVSMQSDLLPEHSGWLASRPPMYLTELGVINIPRLQVAAYIVEGSGDELLYATGHVRETAMPGEEGNCVIAGHRNYVRMRPFRYLDKIQTGDAVLIRFDGVLYTYEVYDVFEVEPDETWVLDPLEDESTLTLLTCTPVMTFSHRLIVRCRLADVQELDD